MRTIPARRLAQTLSLPFVLLGLAVTGCDVLESDQNYTVSHQDVLATTTVDETVHLSGQEALSLQNVNGDIVIEASGHGSMIHIEAELIAGSDSRSDAERWLDRLRVRIEERTRTVSVETDFPNDAKGRRLEVRYHVRIPEGLSVELYHVNGQITVNDVVGHVDVNHINGRVEIDGLHGSADVHLVNGTIDCHMTLGAAGFAFLSTVNGEIQLDIPKDTSARLHAGTSNGEIRFENLSVHGETRNARDRSGTIGDGGSQIELNVVNGTITVRGM